MSGGHRRWEDVKAAARRKASRTSRDSVAEALAADEAAAQAGRRRAADAGGPWAEPVDLGVSIDLGAPLPHLVADGHRAVLLFHAGLAPDPSWDGTTVTVIDPVDATVRRLSWVAFDEVAHVSLGGPNDEALTGHPLYEAGLRHYQAHEVHNSVLIAEMESRNRVHPRPEAFESLRHLVITFHDETFDCVCRSWTSGLIGTSIEEGAARAAAALRTGEFPADPGGTQ